MGEVSFSRFPIVSIAFFWSGVEAFSALDLRLQEVADLAVEPGPGKDGYADEDVGQSLNFVGADFLAAGAPALK